MFQNWIKFLHFKCADSELKCSETPIRVLFSFLSSSLIIKH